MPKNIVICSDGTGNTAIKGRGTNVFKLFEAVDLNGHRWDPRLKAQVAFYDDGVGSENFKPVRLLGGMAGFGLGENVRELYKELARIYDPDDQIFVFGFSRGAFTVRTLVGMIATCGLVDRDPSKVPTAAALDKVVKKAYRAYRQCYRTALGKVFRGEATRDFGKAFREQYSRPEDTRVRFLGVWDTVDAVGLPFHITDFINSTLVRFKFPDPFLSDCVDQACHALSIDDERHSFEPVVWDHRKNADRLEQVWFAGVHSNVGGGYEKQGLSLITLDWMMAKAEQAGLRFHDRDRQFVRDHASVDDKIYDPRAGLGTFYRWKPRDIGAICTANHLHPLIHISAIERIAHGVDHYAPATLPAVIKVVTTPPAADQDPALINQRAANVERVCNEAHRSAEALLPSLRKVVRLGFLSYYLFLVACLSGVFFLVTMNVPGWDTGVVAKAAGQFFATLLNDPFDAMWQIAKAVRAQPRIFSVILLALLLSSVLARVTDKRISDTASAFWYRLQPELRTALKNAKASVGR